MTGTVPFAVPAEILREVRTRWPDTADAWANSAPAQLQRFCDRYQATPTRVMRSRYGLVVKADSPSGPLIFRYSPDPDGEPQSRVAAALAALDVSPRLHETVTTPYGTTTVLDCITPGVPIGDQDTAPSLDRVAAMLRPMSGQPAPYGLPSVLDWLADRLTDDGLTDLAPGRTIAPPDERRAALALLRGLAADHVPALCHGDASPWNILTGTDRLYLIDPRGVTGELAYDVAVIALKGERFAPASAATTGAALAKRLGLAVGRIQAWVRIARAARV